MYESQRWHALLRVPLGEESSPSAAATVPLAQQIHESQVAMRDAFGLCWREQVVPSRSDRLSILRVPQNPVLWNY